MSTLCTTLVGNKCPLLTVTNFASSPEAIARRRAICISARVHPGETCASWTMQGLIEFICGNSPRARILRDNFVFKVVPMLNPDGVINGQYRCSLSGNDLNRQWANPCRMMHPTIYSIKALLRHTKTMRDVSIYCDIHGHSRKCNMFMYGCSRSFRTNFCLWVCHAAWVERSICCGLSSRVWSHLLPSHRVSESLVHAYAARTRRCGSRNEFSPFCCTMRASCSATTTATSKCSAARSLLRAWWPGASSPFPTGNLTLEQTNCKCLPCLAAHLVVFGRAFLLCTYQ